MNPLDHEHIPAGTVRCSARKAPVSAFRDYDRLHVDTWELDIDEARRLRGIINDALPDMIAAQAEMAEEADGEPVDGEGSEVD